MSLTLAKRIGDRVKYSGLMKTEVRVLAKVPEDYKETIECYDLV